MYQGAWCEHSVFKNMDYNIEALKGIIIFAV